MNNYRLSKLTGAVVLALGLSTSVMANTTSSGVKGQITGPNGNPAAGTVVTITHVPSGSTKTAVVNDSGTFASKGLRVGGPYKIVIDSNKFEDTELNNIFLTLGETYPVEVALEADNVEKIVVTGRVVNRNYGSNSPASNFNLKDLELAPTVNRDLKDVVRIDPRVFIDESSGDSIVCAGGNPRFNSLTVDGARMNDNFGLSSTGYPTVRIPFSFDAIDQVAVELAPFDVQYGGFTSCNINAVTKSGSNELKGSVFVDYTSDSLKGDSLEGDDIPTGNYTEKRYGFNVGFPLIEDKLFFFAAYEKLDGSQILQYNAFDNGSISQSEIDDIIRISKDVYDYDPGTMIPSIPVEDEKILVKLDWNINDQHRLNFVYNYNDGFEISQSDSGSTRLSLSNHFYERGAEFTSYVSSLYSDWTDNFSTEVRVGYSKLDNRQISLDQDSGFGEFRIERLGENSDISVYLGPDDSRQSNELNYDTLSLKIAGTYYLDDHELYFGYEREELDVFNLFVQHSQTETRFNNITDFENGLADDIYYGNANSLNPADAAGEFGYVINTVYFQDKFDLIDYDITITAGLRYDWYTSDDLPTENPNFEARNGFSNAQNLDGVDLLQPRLGLNWAVDDQLEVRAGVGLYSGGNPNVWISNSYSNDGIRNIQDSSIRDTFILGDDAIAFDGSGRPGFDIPVDQINIVSTGTADSSTNSTDPDFELPSEWKYSLGLTYVTESEYVLTADYLYTDKKDSAIVTDLAAVEVNIAPDGRPIYESSFGRNNDFYLTNVDGEDGEATVVSFGVSKEFDNGLSVTASYAYTNAKDIHPMTSSVAFSNYHQIAVVDPQNPALSTSNYEVPHRFTLNVSYSHEFFDGLSTNFSLLGQAVQTHGYDYNFSNDSDGFGFNDQSRQLLYVPSVDDSSVVYGADFDQDAFNSFIDSEGLTRGGIVGRNSVKGRWWSKFDIRVEQELPGFTADQSASAYFVIENFGNLLNDDWGVLKEGNFLQGAVEAEILDNGQYSYNSFTSPSTSSRQTDPSLWEIRVGLKYNF